MHIYIYTFKVFPTLLRLSLWIEPNSCCACTLGILLANHGTVVTDSKSCKKFDIYFGFSNTSTAPVVR